MAAFAHLADIHIGAFRQPELQALVLKAFDQALDVCIQREVDFVIISGDLFDSNIPDMSILNSAVKKLSEAKQAGLNIYVVYGNHDFSPTQTSIIDVLESAGLFKKVTRGKVVEGKLQLEFSVDGKTGAKLCGISGRRLGIEREYFEILDREPLEREDGFKIFVFHGAVDPYKPTYLQEVESVPLAALPKGFAYYAAGHIHEKFQGTEYGYTLAYPGTLFAADYRDLEKNADGQERGFFIGTFDSGKLQNLEFIPISICDYLPVEYDATGKNSTTVRNELKELVLNIEPAGKLVLLKVWGEMSGGKTSDIDFRLLSKTIREKSVSVVLNYQQLTSKEYSSVRVAGENPQEIETKLFKENIGTIQVSNKKLKGDDGVKLAIELLKVLRQPKMEVKDAYDSRIVEESIETLELKEAFQTN